MANWKGTAVPNSGYVENVYLNTALSIEEVVGIVRNANLELVTEEQMYIIISDVNDTNTLVLSYAMLDGNEYCLIANIGGGEFNTLFQNIPNELEDFVGWKPNVNNIVEINENVSNVYNGFSVGAENNKLSDLFSITPFTQIEDKNILMHPYNEDGTANKDVNLYPRTKVGNLLASNGGKFTMPNVVYKDGSLYESNADGSANTEKPIEVGISEEQVNTLIDNKITGWLGGES